MAKVILYDNYNGHYYFLKVRSAEHGYSDIEKSSADLFNEVEVRLEKKDFLVNIDVENKGTKNELVDCSKIYKMNKADFEAIYGEPKLLYEIDLAAALKIYTLTYHLLFNRRVVGYEEYTTPLTSLIECLWDSENDELSFITHYMHAKLLDTEINSKERDLDRLIVDKGGGSLTIDAFRHKMVTVHNNNHQTLKEMQGLQIIIGEIVEDLKCIYDDDYKRWAHRDETEVILAKVRSLTPKKMENFNAKLVEYEKQLQAQNDNGL